MPRILLNLDGLRQLTSQLQQATDQLHQMDGRIRNLQADLDWEVRQREGLDGQITQARSQLSNLAGQTDFLSRFLTGKAQDFEDADRQFADTVPTLPAGLQAALNAPPPLDGSADGQVPTGTPPDASAGQPVPPDQSQVQPQAQPVAEAPV